MRETILTAQEREQLDEISMVADRLWTRQEILTHEYRNLRRDDVEVKDRQARLEQTADAINWNVACMVEIGILHPDDAGTLSIFINPYVERGAEQ